MFWCFLFQHCAYSLSQTLNLTERQCSKLGKMCRSHLSCQWRWKALSQYILFWTSENTFACWKWYYRCSIHSFSRACLPHKTVANGTYSLRGNSFFLLHIFCACSEFPRPNLHNHVLVVSTRAMRTSTSVNLSQTLESAPPWTLRIWQYLRRMCGGFLF